MILDIGRVSKAIAGGVTGAVTALAGSGGVTLVMGQYIPARYMDQVPWWAFAGLAAAIGAGGFAVGFAGVYAAPANDLDPNTARLVTAGRNAQKGK